MSDNHNVSFGLANVGSRVSDATAIDFLHLLQIFTIESWTWKELIEGHITWTYHQSIKHGFHTLSREGTQLSFSDFEFRAKIVKVSSQGYLLQHNNCSDKGIFTKLLSLPLRLTSNYINCIQILNLVYKTTFKSELCLFGACCTNIY